MNYIPDCIKYSSRNLRANQTKSEIILWDNIKNKELWFKFLRQKPIYISNENWFKQFIIPDFYCHTFKLIIELDWSIHDLDNGGLLNEVNITTSYLLTGFVNCFLRIFL